MGNVLFVGLEVDDKVFHGCGFIAGVGEKEFSCSPPRTALTKRLLDWNWDAGQIFDDEIARKIRPSPGQAMDWSHSPFSETQKRFSTKCGCGVRPKP